MSGWLVRLVCMGLIGAEFWALCAGERQLLHLFAVLTLGVLAVEWVLSTGRAGVEAEEVDQ
ncbi:hypothetical protein SROCM77S_06828 [Streptomyces rochei]|uniref:hypothetical protein n=1 Tax=Streptomyces sp. NRRL WC-3795 TaxID=1463938 RepID=UPI0004C70235|nr:hypothetical protein [Streptomyces sp. NRRL WC-3795]